MPDKSTVAWPGIKAEVVVRIIVYERQLLRAE